ncbi:S8 family serine peptidase [Halalkalibacterium halodurans]|nr:S8 family serine peptidase [Halalkalibacterium halodurans]MED4081397.1 S8 family serine peptidase [Halalkalibacterium halodurans]MED4083321.1 S8 family serine peptidase [Halalkalibacterium halodurans]MED4106488.1 S8 family serine peptidase [Halalkalibacterium halodurans]MED4108723.1 S8 family serine peptidase [Halalkalibacterium halodurans]MED4149982.1 S8 family serine peptidase [Halalkalibacterium halodurans]
MMRTFRTFVSFTLILLLTLTSYIPVSQANGESPSLAPMVGEIDTSSSALETVIVEIEDPSIIEAKHQGQKQSKNELKQARQSVIEQIQDLVPSSTVTHEYDFLFSGFALELPAHQIPSILGIDGVHAVYPNIEYEVETDFDEVVIEKDAYSPEMLDSAPFIGANDAWEAGYTGEGITVAILDTGVDYTHPDLVHAFGDYKGWDFIDNNDDPQETPPGDPRGIETTHGTHVAGTVAANGLIKGVAPDANLLAYRVLGPGGRGSTAGVIAGIERAVQDGADIMNLSLGNTLNDPDFATSIALDWAMAEGVVAVTSNGNSGPNNWTVGSPGTSRDAISVGATRLPYNKYKASVFTSDGIDYPSADIMGFPSDEELLELDGETYEYAFAGLGKPGDFEGVDVEGKIALIVRGEIPFVEKAENAKAAGAVGAIIYNNVAGVQPTVPGLAIPTIMLSNEDGLKMRNELENGQNTVTFSIEFDKLVGETVADFSSRGPVMHTWMIKPDVSAPGVAIVSTIPTHQPDDPYGYGSRQGTSMASPHVAGAAALLLEAHPNWGVDHVKAALMNTAENLVDENGNRYPHNTQGAGSIRIVDAIESETLVTPGSHSFGTFTKERGKQVERQHFTIHNLSNKRKTYQFDVQFAGNPDGIKVKTSKNLRVQPGKTQKINFNVQVDARKLDPGYYEGTIIVSDGSQTVEVPTILFVSEPDYPRVTTFDLDIDENGVLFGSAYLPNGAEEFGLWIYTRDTLEYVTSAAVVQNIGKGYHDVTWDTTELAPGRYYVFAYAERLGKTDFVLGDEIVVK